MSNIRSSTAPRITDPLQVVLEYSKLGINGRNPRAAADNYLSPDYKEHLCQGLDGPDGFVESCEAQLRLQNPEMRQYIKRTVVEGNMVVVHSQVKLTHDDQFGIQAIEIFRVEDGLIAEHWEVYSKVLEDPKNSNGAF